MNSPTAAHRARERLITDRTNKVSAYCVTNGGNWLGQVLESMCNVVQVNFDPHNSIQMRKRVVQEYLDFVAAPDFAPIAQKDEAFKAVLAFAEIFGAYVDEMNERTNEGQSMLFESSPAGSFGDTAAIAGEVRSNRASSSPVAVGDDSFTKRRASGRQRDQDDEVMTPSLGLVHSPDVLVRTPFGILVRSSSGRFASRSSIAAAPVVGRRKSAVDNDGGSSQPGARKRARGDKVVAASPAVSHLTTRRRSWGEADFDSTASCVVVCTVCGAKVKEGSAMRRHMKGHPAEERGGEGEAAAAEELASLLDQIGTSSEEGGSAAAEDKVESQPAKKLTLVQNMMLNEFGLEEESADEDVMEVEEGGGETVNPAANDLDGWAVDLYNKPATCFLCNKACANYKSISTHLYGWHKGFSRKHYAFQCLGCSHKFRSFTGALGHIQAAFRNKQVGCKNKMAFATAAMIDVKEEDSEPDTPAERGEDARSPTM